MYRAWRWPLFGLGLVFALAYLSAALRTDELTAVVLGAALLTWLVATSNYYYMFAIVLPLLFDERKPWLAVATLSLLAYPHLLIGSDDWIFWQASIAWSLLSVLLVVGVRRGYTRAVAQTQP